MAWPGETDRATRVLRTGLIGERRLTEATGESGQIAYVRIADAAVLGRIRIYDSKLSTGHAGAGKRLLVDWTPTAGLIAPHYIPMALSFGEGIGIDNTAAMAIEVEIYPGVRIGGIRKF